MPAIEVWYHFFESRRRYAYDLHWGMRIARHGNPYIGVDTLRGDWQQARGEALSLDRRKSGWEIGSVEQRIIQIGGELSFATSDKFRQKNPDALEWLASQGCSEAEAMRRFSEQLSEESKHDFWRKKSTGKKVVSRVVVKRQGNGGELRDHDRDGDASSAGTTDS